MLRDYYGRVVGKSLDHPMNDADHEEEQCPRCHGDGMDPYSDYLLECAWCQPEQEVACRRPTLHLRKAVQP